MSYRAFALGTMLAAPVLVMVVQSFTAEHHEEPKQQAAPAPVAPIPTPAPVPMPPPAQDAPSGPTPIFGQPLSGAGEPATPLGATSPSGSPPLKADGSQNF